MPDEKQKAADLADAITAQTMKAVAAMLSMYDDAEKAAYIEGALSGAFMMGRLTAYAESAAAMLAKSG
ncbi:MAG: hypothetical protein ABII76_27405 [Pseudomonadota bacterium]